MTTFLLIALFIIFLSSGAWVIWKYGKRQAELAKTYDKLYEVIQDMVNYLPETAENFDKIENKLIILGNLKYKDKEKTDVLTRTFYRKFGGEYSKRVLKEHEKKMKNVNN